MQLSSANFLPGPVSALLELTGLLRGRGNASEGEQAGGASGGSAGRSSEGGRGGDGGAEVSIRIFGVGESEPVQVSSGPGVASARNGTGSSSPQSVGGVVPMRIAGNESSGSIGGSTGGSVGGSIGHASGGEERGEGLDNEAGGNGREGGSQRYDFQQLARWIEQVLPFTILLLMVFIRQHLQGEWCDGMGRHGMAWVGGGMGTVAVRGRQGREITCGGCTCCRVFCGVLDYGCDVQGKRRAAEADSVEGKSEGGGGGGGDGGHDVFVRRCGRRSGSGFEVEAMR